MIRHAIQSGLAFALLAMAPVARADTPSVTATNPPPVAAQPSAAPAAPSAPVDPVSLALAHQLVDIAMPPASRMEMMDRITTAMLKPLKEQFNGMPGMDDAGFRAIFDGFLSQLPAMSHDVMGPIMPQLADAMALSYARLYSRDDLTQVVAFAHTPAGERYLQRATLVMQDPDIQAVFAQLMQAMQQRQQASLVELQRSTRAYLAAHPDLAKRMAQQAKPH